MRSRTITYLDLEDIDASKSIPELQLETAEQEDEEGLREEGRKPNSLKEEIKDGPKGKESKNVKLYAEKWQENETSIILKMLDDSFKNRDIERLSALQRSLLTIERKSEHHVDSEEEDFSLPSLSADIENTNNSRKASSTSLPQIAAQSWPTEKKKNSSRFISFTEGSPNFSPKEQEYLKKVMEQNLKNYDEQIVITIVGNARTGKTSLVKSFLGSKFEIDTPSSFGLDTKTFTRRLKKREIRFKIIDTDADKSKEFIRKVYYEMSQLIIVLFDLTNLQSFKDVTFWINSITKNSETKPLIYLVGNKRDLKKQREVSFKQASLFSKSQGMPYREISNKNCCSVDKLLEHISTVIISKSNAPLPAGHGVTQELSCAGCVVIQFFSNLGKVIISYSFGKI